ncbi:MAG: hypothetical protein P1V36_00125 [Planctomycetota bacterium]|nr:hypothetical protein [Planctomycetota bacterium]
MAVYGTTDDTDRASVGTSFDAAKSHEHALNTASLKPTNSKFSGKLSGLFVQVSSISSAASITVRLTRDSGGDEMVVPDTTATLSTGITTATDGSAVYKIDVDWVDPADVDSLFLFVKTDAGTVTLDRSVLTWTD